LLAQLDGQIDVFVASIGTGGTFMGISQVLKEALPNVICIAVEPTGWEGFQDPLSADKVFIDGINDGITKEIRDMGLADEIIWLGNEEPREMAYRLSHEEGLYVGISSGANVVACLEVAKRRGMQGKNIVTVMVDRGDRYISDERYIT
jgi:cysteine synthase A